MRDIILTGKHLCDVKHEWTVTNYATQQADMAINIGNREAKTCTVFYCNAAALGALEAMGPRFTFERVGMPGNQGNNLYVVTGFCGDLIAQIHSAFQTTNHNGCAQFVSYWVFQVA